MAFVEHDFLNGLTVKNWTLFAQLPEILSERLSRQRTLSGAVNPADTAFNRAAYNNATNRDNAFNQTDFIYKGATGPILHTLGFGTEFGRQAGIDVRDTGIFPNGTNTIVVDPFNPTYFGPVNFIHHFTGANADGVTTPDSNSKYLLNTQSGYVRDTIEVTRYLQFIAGVRYDRFDVTALDKNTNPGTTRNRVDSKLSPQLAAIVKPMENLSFYGVYSHVVPAGLRRPVQRAQRRHRDSGAAEVREHGGRRQMEHLSAAALQRRGLSTSSGPTCRSPIRTIRDSSSRRAGTTSKASRPTSTATSRTSGSPSSATPIPTRA